MSGDLQYGALVPHHGRPVEISREGEMSLTRAELQAYVRNIQRAERMANQHKRRTEGMVVLWILSVIGKLVYTTLILRLGWRGEDSYAYRQLTIVTGLMWMSTTTNFGFLSYILRNTGRPMKWSKRLTFLIVWKILLIALIFAFLTAGSLLTSSSLSLIRDEDRGNVTGMQKFFMWPLIGYTLFYCVIFCLYCCNCCSCFRRFCEEEGGGESSDHHNLREMS